MPCSKKRHRRIAEEMRAQRVEGGRKMKKRGTLLCSAAAGAFISSPPLSFLKKRTRNMRNSSVENAGSSTLNTASPAGEGCRRGGCGADILLRSKALRIERKKERSSSSLESGSNFLPAKNSLFRLFPLHLFSPFFACFSQSWRTARDQAQQASCKKS